MEKFAMCPLHRGTAEDGVCTGPEEAPFSNYSKGTMYRLGGPESYKTVKSSDVETILDEVVREGLGTEIQMMRPSKEESLGQRTLNRTALRQKQTW